MSWPYIKIAISVIIWGIVILSLASTVFKI